MEKIFNEIAKKNMLNWNLAEFKKTHPRLYKTIIESLSEIQEINAASLRNKLRLDLGDAQVYKDAADDIYSEKSSVSGYAKSAFLRGAEYVIKRVSNSLKS